MQDGSMLSYDETDDQDLGPMELVTRSCDNLCLRLISQLNSVLCQIYPFAWCDALHQSEGTQNVM